ncbi:MAG: hypothetical protein IOC94_14435, partial [Methylocystis sp.]|nr:hypothetical protein [Methylocystis sp.]
VENLVLTGASAINGTGNDYANMLTGNTGNNVLNGGLGADTLAGGLGNDVFVYGSNFGFDTISDFDQAGDDQLQFSTAVFSNWQAVWSATKQVGMDVVITKSASDSITLKNLALSSFAADDLRFVT